MITRNFTQKEPRSYSNKDVYNELSSKSYEALAKEGFYGLGGYYTHNNSGRIKYLHHNSGTLVILRDDPRGKSPIIIRGIDLSIIKEVKSKLVRLLLGIELKGTRKW